MSWSRKAKTKRLIVPILLLILIGSLLVTASALALDVGLQYGTLTGLGTQDIRVSIMQVIRVILGFLGVLAIAIVLYAGYTWMTAAGNAEKIGTAKKILVNAVIGLVIIFTAFAVSSFIIDALIRATGAGQGGGGCTPGVCAGCNVICGSNGQSHEYDPVNCGGEVYCSEPVLNCPKPETPTPRICRVEAVRGTTPIGGQPQGAAGDYVTIEGWYFGSYLAGTSKVEFGSAQAEIVNCNGNPIWDEAANHYGRTRVQVPAIDPNNYFD
jgi:hypothetical protein